MTDPKPKARRTRPTAASSTAKRKVNKAEDKAGDPTEAGPLHKKAKTQVENDLLSHADDAELIGQVAIELEGIQGALNHTCDTLALFTAHANGKHHVTLRAPF